MRVEELDEDGWERLRELRLRAVRAEPQLYGWAWERESRFQEMHWRLRLRGARWWAAGGETFGADHADIGLVSMISEPGAPPSERHLVALWVGAEARRRGAGGGLVAAAVAAAGEDSDPARATRLTAWVPADPAVGAFWSACGFVPTGEVVASTRAPGGEEERWARRL